MRRYKAKKPNTMELNTKVCLLVLIASLVSCKPNHESLNIQRIAHDYIDDFFDRNLKSREFLLTVQIDSSHSDYFAHRIYMNPELMDKTDDIPNQIEVYRGVKIVYYTELMSSEKTSEQMKSRLEKGNFFRKDALLTILSNYPEWIVLQKKDQRDYLIVKDQWYAPLSEVVEKSDGM